MTYAVPGGGALLLLTSTVAWRPLPMVSRSTSRNACAASLMLTTSASAFSPAARRPCIGCSSFKARSFAAAAWRGALLGGRAVVLLISVIFPQMLLQPFAFAALGTKGCHV